LLLTQNRRLTIKRAAREGVRMTCADGLDRLCFSILDGFVADYLEQALITGVKNNKYCPIYEMRPECRHDLCGQLVQYLRTALDDLFKSESSHSLT
jgi:Plavaka transposase